ncbi:MAG: hypothetical protein U9Q88_01310 [Bacillota bacterium]|jgi:hypothetical protein|nr:hypothetical protein [Bacillota bacterium]
MTFLTIVAVLILGISMLVIGYITKKNWLKLLSLFPTLISVIQLIILMNL